MNKKLVFCICTALLLLFFPAKAYAAETATIPQDIQELVAKYAAKYELPQDLVVKVIQYEYKNESGERTGLMKVNPSGYEGVIKEKKITNLNEVSSNLDIGCYILKDKLSYVKNDEELVLGEYFCDEQITELYGVEMLCSSFVVE